MTHHQGMGKLTKAEKLVQEQMLALLEIREAENQCRLKPKSQTMTLRRSDLDQAVLAAQPQCSPL
jgi:hypothetical protein